MEKEQKARNVQEVGAESRSEKIVVGDGTEAFRLSREIIENKGPKRVELAIKLLGLLDKLEDTVERNKIYNKETIEVERKRMNKIIENLEQNN